MSDRNPQVRSTIPYGVRQSIELSAVEKLGPCLQQTVATEVENGEIPNLFQAWMIHRRNHPLFSFSWCVDPGFSTGCIEDKDVIAEIAIEGADEHTDVMDKFLREREVVMREILSSNRMLSATPWLKDLKLVSGGIRTETVETKIVSYGGSGPTHRSTRTVLSISFKLMP